jgi:hypothetical protein
MGKGMAQSQPVVSQINYPNHPTKSGSSNSWQSAPAAGADSSSNRFATALLKQLLHSGRSTAQRAAIAADGFGDEVDPSEIAAEMSDFSEKSSACVTCVCFLLIQSSEGISYRSPIYTDYTHGRQNTINFLNNYQCDPMCSFSWIWA